MKQLRLEVSVARRGGVHYNIISHSAGHKTTSYVLSSDLDREEAIRKREFISPDLPLPPLLESIFPQLSEQLREIWKFDEEVVRALRIENSSVGVG